MPSGRDQDFESGSLQRRVCKPSVPRWRTRLAAPSLVLDAWCYHPQLPDVIALARAVPQATIAMCHIGGVLGYGAYAGKKDEIHAAWTTLPVLRCFPVVGRALRVYRFPRILQVKGA
jgi:hypothetical protein